MSWLADRDLDAARAAWREVLAGFDVPTLVGPPHSSRLGARGVSLFGVSAETTRGLAELARSSHTTLNIVLQAAWAQLLGWVTGHHDVAFGTTVSGRPAEVPGAESIVGLMINTVPVRANLTAATTTADLIDGLQGAYNDTLRAPAPRVKRDAPHHRPRKAVRHAFRLRELPGRHRCIVGRPRVGHYRRHRPRIQPLSADSASPARTATGASRRIRHRRLRRRPASRRWSSGSNRC